MSPGKLTACANSFSNPLFLFLFSNSFLPKNIREREERDPQRTPAGHLGPSAAQQPHATRPGLWSIFPSPLGRPLRPSPRPLTLASVSPLPLVPSARRHTRTHASSQGLPAPDPLSPSSSSRAAIHAERSRAPRAVLCRWRAREFPSSSRPPPCARAHAGPSFLAPPRLYLRPPPANSSAGAMPLRRCVALPSSTDCSPGLRPRARTP